MAASPSASDNTDKSSEYVVVLKAPSSARFEYGQGLELFVDCGTGLGSVRFHLLTRWVEEGHDSPVPRELWIEALGHERSLDRAIEAFSPAARVLAQIVSFCANVQVGTPEMHLAYDRTGGRTRREFLEVHLPDERGMPREGRAVNPAETQLLALTILSSSDSERLTRALQQYTIALRYWYFGGEWLALTHLYIAVENLTKAAIRRTCALEGMNEEELARSVGIDVTEPHYFKASSSGFTGGVVRSVRLIEKLLGSLANRIEGKKAPTAKWQHNLDVWCRRSVIFKGDNACYQKARKASDGVEHGFMELSAVNKAALSVTEAVFTYVREAFVFVIGLPVQEHSTLLERTPLDVQSMRKMFRGDLLSEEGQDPAPSDSEYPTLEWTSKIGRMWRDDKDELRVGFDERLRLKAADGISFEGRGFEVIGRPKEDGSAPVEFNMGDVSVVPNADRAGLTKLLDLCKRARSLTGLVASSTPAEVPAWVNAPFRLYAQQVALLESVDLLISDGRAIEAAVLTERMIIGAAQLELLSNFDSGPRAGCLCLEWEEAGRLIADGFEGDLEAKKKALLEMSIEVGVDITKGLPKLSESAFYSGHSESLDFLRMMRANNLFSSYMRGAMKGEVLVLSTRELDSPFLTGAATLAVETIVFSIKEYAKIAEITISETDLVTMDALSREADEIDSAANETSRSDAEG